MNKESNKTKNVTLIAQPDPDSHDCSQLLNLANCFLRICRISMLFVK